jgi:oligopeptide/dipeptide ABC transporter ATP-binding protein
MITEPLIDVKNLKVYFGLAGKGLFRKRKALVKAVDDISFSISKGETFGLVGESGSGKTTLGHAILCAIDITEGQVIFRINGVTTDVTKLRGRDLRNFQRHMQVIFQDPYTSLNPRMTVRDIIAEPLEVQKFGTRADIDELVRETANKCKLNVEHLRRFPHAFSGGQRQRISIARALVANPEFIVCDESVSALDVSIQADIINLLIDLQQELGLTYLFIAHDLSVIAQITKRTAVMYVGKFVELAPTEIIFAAPKHPYTRALISAIPHLYPTGSFEKIKLEGEIPNPVNVPSGCSFHTRCPFAGELCKEKSPEWHEISMNHFVSCHYADELTL